MKQKTDENTQTTKKKFVVHKYSVVKFDEEDGKFFECIPDRWFVNELRESCFFPPNTGKSYMQRAINCEKPDDHWGIYNCSIVSGGFLTYHAGFKMVKEKCAQRYNTSSADEEIQAADFRRKHPALIGENFEHIFSKPTSTVNANESAEGSVNGSTIVNESVNGAVNGSTTVNKSSVGKDTGVVLKKTNAKETTSNDVEVLTGDKEEIGVLSKKSDHSKRSHATVQSSSHPRSSRSRSKDSRLSRRRSSHSRSGGKNSGVALKKTNAKETTSSDVEVLMGDKQEIGVLSKKSDHSKKSHATVQSSPQPRSSRSRSKDSRLNHRRFSHSRSGSQQSKNTCSNKDYPSRSSSPRNSRSRSRSVQSTRPSRQSYSRSRSNDRRTRRHSQSLESRFQSSLFNRSPSRSQQSNHSRFCSNTDHPSRSSHRRSSHSRSSSSPSRSRSAQSSRQSRTSYSRSTSKGQRRFNRHSSSVQSRSTQSSLHQLHSKRRANIGSKTPSNRERSNNNKPKGCKKNGKNANSGVRMNIVADRGNKMVSNRNSSLSEIRLNSHQSTLSSQSNLRNSSPSRSSSNASVKQLIASVNELTKVVKRNNDRLTQNDRRLNRLEVTINKIFITVGDMNGNNRINDENDLATDFNFPDLPLVSKTELYTVYRKLKDKEFRRVWLNKERNFCCPTKTSTDTVTITKYLKRFVSLNVRCQITLKEAGQSGLTLYKDYHRVYSFLVDVMTQGYRLCGKKITVDEAHTALRVVWGRSKQLKNAKKK